MHACITSLVVLLLGIDHLDQTPTSRVSEVQVGGIWNVGTVVFVQGQDVMVWTLCFDYMYSPGAAGCDGLYLECWNCCLCVRSGCNDLDPML